MSTASNSPAGKIIHDGGPGDECFCLLVDHAPFMLWASGTDGLCNYFNRPWLDFRGRTMAQEIGDGWAQGVHPEDLKPCMETYQRSFALQQAFQMEYRLQR